MFVQILNRFEIANFILVYYYLDLLFPYVHCGANVRYNASLEVFLTLSNQINFTHYYKNWDSRYVIAIINLKYYVETVVT